MTAATALTRLDRENPWPGLEAFEENARAFFHGREREAKELLRHVLDAPITVLFGRSGLGKTSLLQAGLFPLLRERHFLPVYVRFGLELAAAPLSRQLYQSVRDAVRADAPDAMLPSEEESLWEYLHRADLELWNARNYLLTPVIVLDQFEELFTLGERVPDLVRAFMNDLGDLAENRIPADLAARIDHDEAVAAQFHLPSHNYKLLISLREDFLPDLEGWQRRIPALGRSRMRLLPLRAVDALDAVHKPAAHLMMTDALARRVVDHIAGEDLHRGRDAARADVDHPGDDLGVSDVDPALLSLFCRELNEDRKGHGQPYFDEQLFEHAKDTTLANYYSSCVRDLPERVADFIESELITGKGFRNSYAREDAVPSRLTEDELAQLISSRLLRIVDHYGAQRIELTHDVLTGVVREHRDRRRAEQEKAALAARVEQERQAARELAAAEAERQVAREKEHTAAVLRKRARILQAVLAVTAVIALLAVGVSGWALRAQREATELRFRQATAASTAARLLGEAQSMLAGQGSGDEVRAMQQILAASVLAPVLAEGTLLDTVIAERGALNIFETTQRASAVAFSFDGQRVVTGTDDGTVRVWDAVTGQPVGAPLIGHTGAVTSVTFSPDGRLIASGSDDGSLRLWDATTGRPVGAPLIGHTGAVTSVAFSPDGTRIVSGSADTTLRLWDATTGRPVGAPLIGHTGAVTSVAFSPDGTRIVSGSADTTLRLWDATTGRPVGAPLIGHTGAVTSVAFSPDGTRIVSGSADTTLRLWDATAGRPVGAPLVGHVGAVTSVAFSSDGTRIVSGSADTTVRLWDVVTGGPVGQSITGHTGAVWSVAFSPDEQRILSGSQGGTVRVWPGPEAWRNELCAKLNTNMSHQQWNDWVSPNINYVVVCPGLPIPVDG